MTHILVTGGAGYIGSVTCKVLAEAGHNVAVFDNLSTGHRDFVQWGDLTVGDIRDTDRLTKVLKASAIEAVIHFAASAYVGESVKDPGAYFDNNVAGTLSLLKAMQNASIHHLVVSSSCAVYGEPETMPITEDTPTAPINPYGASKLFMERMCADFDVAHGLKTVALRYFNACGADASLCVGERHDPEPHLIPRILMAADGAIEAFQIFGDDYDTPDGTCIRDFVHVTDLARAHLSAVEYLIKTDRSGIFNLGTGVGVSVQEIIAAAGIVIKQDVPTRITDRRPGDPPVLVASAKRANSTLKWKPQHSDIETILNTAWGWYRTGGKRPSSRSIKRPV